MLVRWLPSWERASHFIATSKTYKPHKKKPTDFCPCENKGTDQLCSNCTADQRLCFRYTYSTTPLLCISKMSNFQHSSVTVQAALCQTWLEILKTSFLVSQLILHPIYGLFKNVSFFKKKLHSPPTVQVIQKKEIKKITKN